MKRLFSLFIAIVLFTMPFTASAVNDTPTGEIICTTVEILDDGTILETVIYVENSTASTYATKTVSGSKTTTGKNEDGEILWKFTLNGTFTVNTGVSATCTAASYSTSNLASGWSLDSASTSKTGNKAKADFVFKHKVLFVTTQTVEKSLTLTCSSDGTLS